MLLNVYIMNCIVSMLKGTPPRGVVKYKTFSICMVMALIGTDSKLICLGLSATLRKIYFKIY